MIKFDKLILSSPAPGGGGEEVRSLTSLPITISKTKHILHPKKKKQQQSIYNALTWPIVILILILIHERPMIKEQ